MIIPRIIYLSCGFIAGIVFRTLFPETFGIGNSVLMLTMAVAFTITGWTVYREYQWHENPKWLMIMPVMLGAFCLGSIRTNQYLNSAPRARKFFAGLKDNTLIDFEGNVAAEPEFRSVNYVTLRVTADRIRVAGTDEWQRIEPSDIKVTVYIPKYDEYAAEFCRSLADSDTYGYRLQVSGIYTRLKAAANPGGFDEKLFFRAEKYSAAVKVFDWHQPKSKRGEIAVIEQSRGNFLMESALSVKRYCLGVYKRCILPPENRLVSGATLGTRFALRNREYRGTKIEDLFRHAGVGHVLAVSGLHVSVVSLLLYSLFRLSRISPKYFAPLVILLLICFTMLTGARPSSSRATIMNAFIILSFVYCGISFKNATFAGMGLASFLILFKSPFILYSAGFLLSFGAVLSLVLLTGPLDRLFSRLRGFSLILVLLWYAGVIIFASHNWVVFLRWEWLLTCVALLMLLVLAGCALNNRYPVLLKFSYDLIPHWLRFFFSAQAAIQIGMMIPMSAYFFGHYPIAGIFVNFFAIPLVGILVQLGLLIGMVSVIPFIGSFLALLLGAAEYLTAKLFIFIAWLGTVIFPYPPVPRPSVNWLIVYYSCVVIFLIVAINFTRIQTVFYRFYEKFPNLIGRIPACAAVLLLGGAWVRPWVAGTKPYTLDILSGSNTPVICITGGNYRTGAVVINSGSAFFTGRSVVSAIAARGGDSIDCYIASGRRPELGGAGLSKLLGNYQIKKICYPAFPERNKLPSFKNAVEYFLATGDKKMARYAEEERSWALKGYDIYDSIQKKLPESGAGLIAYRAPCQIPINDSVHLNFLTANYHSYAAVVQLQFGKRKYLIVADPGGKKNADAINPDTRYHAVVFAGPERFSGRYYLPGLQKILEKIKTEEIIFCFDKRRFSNRKLWDIAASAIAMARKSSAKIKVIRTDQHGAVTEQTANSLSISGTGPQHVRVP